MKSFHFQNSDYRIRKLKPKHQEAIQSLLEKCSDYYLLVEGEPCSPWAATELFLSTPPGKSLNNKFIYGFWKRSGDIFGLIEGMSNYPTESDWWIALFLLDPKFRGQGFGREIIENFNEFVRLNHGKTIMLGVVEANKTALLFWKKQGFAFVRQTEFRQFGRKIQRVIILQKLINQSC